MAMEIEMEIDMEIEMEIDRYRAPTGPGSTFRTIKKKKEINKQTVKFSLLKIASSMPWKH